jgi:hypothetical protein
MVRVQGLRGLALRLSNTVGPLLAGLVLAAGGPAGGFTTAAVLFGASLVLLITVRVRPIAHDAARAPSDHGLRDGRRFLRRHPVLLPLITVVALSEVCFSGPVITGLVLLADERGWGTTGTAWIAGAFSVGGAAASLVLTVRPAIPRAGLVVAASLIVTAAVTTAVGATAGLAPAVALGAAAGVTSGITMTITSALVQTVVPPDHLGRVTAVTSLFTLGLAPVLLPAVGFVIAWWGAAVFFAGCGGVLLVAATVAFAARPVRCARLIGSPGSLAER